ncbi:MAG TPA: pitrilysin family protein [Williamwhitmania sp.]|nr:pitrilysin family protein [Williamwhitmania sp.]
MLNRIIAPIFSLPESLDIISSHSHTLSNGIPVHMVEGGTQDVLRITFLFNAGTRYQTKPLVAATTLSMLTEGTKSHTANQLAELLEYHGAYTDQGIDRDKAGISLYCLGKYVPNLLPLLQEILLYPTFPAKQFETLTNKRMQQLTVERQKVAYLAREQHQAMLFGEKHPYGSYATPESYSKLMLEDLVNFHKEYYKPEECLIILAGKSCHQQIPLLEHFFGNAAWLKTTPGMPKRFPIPSSASEKQLTFTKDNAVQTAIRIGKISITQNHPDYVKLSILITVLGGYFGSRLMKNIREDKGYTYGIYASLVPFKEAGIIVISTEVGKQYQQDTIDQVMKEIERLRTEKISDEELVLVKNYIAGEMIRSVDGPMALSEILESLSMFDQDFSYLTEAYKETAAVTADELLLLAQQYLSPNDLKICIVG